VLQCLACRAELCGSKTLVTKTLALWLGKGVHLATWHTSCCCSMKGPGVEAQHTPNSTHGLGRASELTCTAAELHTVQIEFATPLHVTTNLQPHVWCTGLEDAAAAHKAAVAATRGNAEPDSEPHDPVQSLMTPFTKASYCTGRWWTAKQQNQAGHCCTGTTNMPVAALGSGCAVLLRPASTVCMPHKIRSTWHTSYAQPSQHRAIAIT